jgi:hypothetical protein
MHYTPDHLDGSQIFCGPNSRGFPARSRPPVSDSKLNAAGRDFLPNLVRLSVPHYLRLQVEDAETANLR